MDRDSLGSWLSGPRAAAEASGVDLGFPGERLGLPADGPGSVAGWGRRFGALGLDWLVALGTTRLVTPGVAASSLAHSLVVLAVFTLTVAVLSALQHASFGQRVVGLCLVPVRGDDLAAGRVVVRTLLVASVIPALLYDRDRRGLPDHVAGTVLVNVR